MKLKVFYVFQCHTQRFKFRIFTKLRFYLTENVSKTEFFPVHGKKQFNKVYRIVEELGIQAFTEQNFTKFIELFIIIIKLNNFS